MQNGDFIAQNPLFRVHTMPFFSKDRCEEIIAKACAMNRWSTNRHKDYPTTDIPVHEIDGLHMTDDIMQISTACMEIFFLLILYLSN